MKYILGLPEQNGSSRIFGFANLNKFNKLEIWEGFAPLFICFHKWVVPGNKFQMHAMMQCCKTKSENLAHILGYQTRDVTKSQALAEFTAEWTKTEFDDPEEETCLPGKEDPDTWTMHFNSSYTKGQGGAGVVLSVTLLAEYDLS